MAGDKQNTAPKKINIENIKKRASYQKMSKKDQDALIYVLKRQRAMDNKRQKKSRKWDFFDTNFDLITEDTKNGQAGANIPYEQFLIDTYLGTLPEGLPIKVSSKIGRVDGNQLLMGKYTLEHFMEREETVNEIDTFDKKKSRYGTGWLYSGLWFDVRYSTKSTEQRGDDNDYFSTADHTESHINWHIGIRGDIDIRKVWIDDRVKQYKNAMDEVYQEDISPEEFEMRYKGRNGFNYVDAIMAEDRDNTQEVPGKEVSNEDGNYKIWHYWNIYNGTYKIIVNETWTMFNGYIQESHGFLPLIPVQHYPDSEDIYGVGIPERYSTIKPFINQFLNYSLDGAKLNASLQVFTSNEATLDGEIYADPGVANIVEYTGDAKGIQPFQPNTNVNQALQILKIMEDFGSQSVGFDPRTSYQASSDKVGIVAVLKEEQNQRARPVARNRNLGLAKAFTIMLINISKFAPHKYAQLIFDENTNELSDYNWYQIELPNKKIVRNEAGDILSVDDAPGETDFFELTDTLLYKGVGLKVEIETPSNINTMKSLERIDLQEAIKTLTDQYTITQDPSILEVLKKFNQRMFDLYSIDPDHMSIKSTSDKNKKFIGDANAAIMQMGGNVLPPGTGGPNAAIPALQNNAKGGILETKIPGGVPAEPQQNGSASLTPPQL